MAPVDDDDRPPRLSDAELWRRVAGSVRPLVRERDHRSSETQVPQTQVPQTQVPQTQIPQTQAPETEVPQPEPPETKSNPADISAKAQGPQRHRAPLDARSPEPAPDDFWTLTSQNLGPQDLTHGAAVGLDKRTLSRLRRGMLPIEGAIDLHGLTQAEAHLALHRFITASQQKGRRCVLVITGKGSRYGGVLRAAVPHWLNLPANRSLVLAFAYATPAHGGAGALYILLRRRRPAP